MNLLPRRMFPPRFSAVLALALLAACGKAPEAPAPVRPVLVVHPLPVRDAGLLAFPGEVKARHESPLSFRVGGKLVERKADVGDRVGKGDVLAVVDPGDLSLQARAAKAQLAAADADLVRAKGDLARYAKLVDQQLISRSAYDAQLAAWKAAEGQAHAARAQAEVAGNQAGYTQLRAPADGAIASRQVETGQVVAAGQTVFTLAADGEREVAIDLPESRIDEFRAGQPVQVELWSTTGERMPGRIREIGPVADAATRTYPARVTLLGDAVSVVELGRSARVYVQPDGGDAQPLLVPLAAIQRGKDGRTAVWRIDPKTHTVASRPVRVGDYGENGVPVLGGLEPGDWVVASGGHLLREGQRVEAVDRNNHPVLTSAPAPAKAD